MESGTLCRIERLRLFETQFSIKGTYRMLRIQLLSIFAVVFLGVQVHATGAGSANYVAYVDLFLSDANECANNIQATIAGDVIAELWITEAAHVGGILLSLNQSDARALNARTIGCIRDLKAIESFGFCGKVEVSNGIYVVDHHEIDPYGSNPLKISDDSLRAIASNVGQEICAQTTKVIGSEDLVTIDRVWTPWPDHSFWQNSQP